MGPAPGESFGKPGYQQSEHRIGRGGRDQAPPPPPVIDYNRIPTAAPFNTFVGNLPFEISDADLRIFFADVKIKEIKIPLDQEQKTRGFAYVEFSDQDSMIKALMMSGQVHSVFPFFSFNIIASKSEEDTAVLILQKAAKEVLSKKVLPMTGELMLPTMLPIDLVAPILTGQLEPNQHPSEFLIVLK